MGWGGRVGFGEGMGSAAKKPYPHGNWKRNKWKVQTYLAKPGVGHLEKGIERERWIAQCGTENSRNQHRSRARDHSQSYTSNGTVIYGMPSNTTP